jgi:hypothetical protein
MLSFVFYTHTSIRTFFYFGLMFEVDSALDLFLNYLALLCFPFSRSGDKEAAAKYQMLLEEKKKRKDGDDVQMRRIEKLLHRGSSSVYSQAHLKLREDEDDDDDEDEDSSSSDDDDQNEEAESKSKQNKKTQSADSDDDDDEEDVDADLFRVKRRDHELVDHEAVATGKKSRMQIKLERLKAKVCFIFSIQSRCELDTSMIRWFHFSFAFFFQ